MASEMNRQFYLIKLLVFVVPVHSSVFSNLPGLDRFCSLNGDNIRCDIHVVNLLDFKDVRQLLSDVSDTSGVILNITCGYIGQLRLPWPMKSRNIKELWVDGCHVLGFYSEINKIHSEFIDQMTLLHMTNCVLENSVIDAFNLFSTETSKSFECGQLTLRSLTMRNVSNQFVLEPNDMSSLETKGVIMDAGDVLLSNKIPSPYNCIYTNLEKIDISNNFNGLEFFVLPLENSEFPKLTLFNMSNNGIASFPEEVINSQLLFPNLEYLDLSSNEIDEINIHLNNEKMSKILLINLQNNLFETVPQQFIDHADRQRILDLSENPLKCGCDILNYKRYLQSFPNAHQTKDILKNTSCVEKSGNQITLLELQVKNC